MLRGFAGRDVAAKGDAFVPEALVEFRQRLGVINGNGAVFLQEDMHRGNGSFLRGSNSNRGEKQKQGGDALHATHTPYAKKALQALTTI